MTLLLLAILSILVLAYVLKYLLESSVFYPLPIMNDLPKYYHLVNIIDKIYSQREDTNGNRTIILNLKSGDKAANFNAAWEWYESQISPDLQVRVNYFYGPCSVTYNFNENTGSWKISSNKYKKIGVGLSQTDKDRIAQLCSKY